MVVPSMPLKILQNLFRRLDRLIFYLIIRPFGLSQPVATTDDSTFTKKHVVLPRSIMRPLLELQKEVLSSFSRPCSIETMKYMSSCLRDQYVKKLQSDTACMLPSFCHTLPTGQERGTFIALDLGGSTFRVALVELSTRSSINGGMEIKHMTVNKINEKIRQLGAADFFAWMAGRIQDMLYQCNAATLVEGEPIAIGLAWSFPVEQTSHQGGTVQPMGKGFRAHEGVVGQDLGALIEKACRNIGIEVRVNAVINDSSATLLSQAYKDPATKMGLILGTGTNAAVYLPVKDLGAAKFGLRDASWFQQAEKVIINTEVSMFGKDILPKTRWDEELNRVHQLPDFQPLEYMTTGRYLGELFRLVIVEAIETSNLFGGSMPESISGRYTVDTALLAAIEEDATTGCVKSAERVQKEFELLSPPTLSEMSFLKSVVEAISHRAAAYVATAVHALWSLEHKNNSEQSTTTSIAANGSVILMYPGFRARCQAFIADIMEANRGRGDSKPRHRVLIQPTDEATILGVAVAVAIADKT